MDLNLSPGTKYPNWIILQDTQSVSTKNWKLLGSTGKHIIKPKEFHGRWWWWGYSGRRKRIANNLPSHLPVNNWSRERKVLMDNSQHSFNSYRKDVITLQLWLSTCAFLGKCPGYLRRYEEVFSDNPIG